MKYNFFAGPAILPQPVMRQAAEAVIDFNNMGLSILEISHRSNEVIDVFDEAESIIYELLNIDRDQYAVMFLSGGASSQFFMTAMNLLNPNESAGYVDTGSWSSKAIKEAKLFGNINIIASSKEAGYTHIPKKYEIPSNLSYVHITSNNTIYGTQYQTWPESPVPLVSDMSSDIFSRRLPMEKFDLIYAGAQKNLGPAGVTLVIVKKEITGKVNRIIPTMLQYPIHIEHQSMYNTPPVFPVYVSMLTLRWLKKLGGLSAMEKRNQEKAVLLYREIDRNPLFKGNVVAEDRSLMNVCFVALNEAHEKPFLSLCESAGCVGLKGHRSAGGFRASIYNAMDKKGVQVLVDVMQDFEKKYG
ncbi:MAG TPA: 3-phosphoserine/phosphohydroxythreonine transaminase [Saprospiraceae bacterium]|nr:3-phosphoserine/phosphohydroxythreonine transaminase [Saprospiraceae bacterium]